MGLEIDSSIVSKDKDPKIEINQAGLAIEWIVPLTNTYKERHKVSSHRVNSIKSTSTKANLNSKTRTIVRKHIKFRPRVSTFSDVLSS